MIFGEFFSFSLVNFQKLVFFLQRRKSLSWLLGVLNSFFVIRVVVSLMEMVFVVVFDIDGYFLRIVIKVIRLIQECVGDGYIVGK